MTLRHALRLTGLLASALLFGLSASFGAWAEPKQQASIAIIIDDIGHHYRHGALLAEMPYPMTLAILPERRYTQELAELAHQHGKEIMLHAPMENTVGFALGKGGLTQNMDEQAFKQSLAKSLANIPYVQGVNNHMGSLLTTKRQAMNWLMEHLRDTPYYFVDSRTSANSVAAKVAREQGVPNLSRDIFLDHEQSEDYVAAQFEKLIRRARKHGTAIGIGHPHGVTIAQLQKVLPTLDEQGISLATVSGLWQLKHPYSQRPRAQQGFTLATKTPSSALDAARLRDYSIHNATASNTAANDTATIDKPVTVIHQGSITTQASSAPQPSQVLNSRDGLKKSTL